jgi:antitoxin HicB
VVKCPRLSTILYTAPEKVPLPELVTEGDTLDEAYANVRDALAAVVELYADEGRPLPASVLLPASGEVVWSDVLVETT